MKLVQTLSLTSNIQLRFILGINRVTRCQHQDIKVISYQLLINKKYEDYYEGGKEESLLRIIGKW